MSTIALYLPWSHDGCLANKHLSPLCTTAIAITPISSYNSSFACLPTGSILGKCSRPQFQHFRLLPPPAEAVNVPQFEQNLWLRCHSNKCRPCPKKRHIHRQSFETFLPAMDTSISGNRFPICRRFIQLSPSFKGTSKSVKSTAKCGVVETGSSPNKTKRFRFWSRKMVSSVQHNSEGWKVGQEYLT